MADLLMFGVIGFILFLSIPIVICWILFGIAKFYPWDHPNITPVEIIEKLSKNISQN